MKEDEVIILLQNLKPKRSTTELEVKALNKAIAIMSYSNK